MNIWIDNVSYRVQEGLSILKVCEANGILIPRFCYNEKLSISGNCRICLVEIVGIGKPVLSCITTVKAGMKVWTVSALANRSSTSVSEMVLKNHPLDCAICDQGGECDLQTVSMSAGNDTSRSYKVQKRPVGVKSFGVLVKTEMQRCIQCTRCVRYMSQVVGYPSIGMIGRSEMVEVSSYQSSSYMNKVSGNLIELCPVGIIVKPCE